MGQQASKKSKKGSKDKDKEEDLASAQETATDGRPQNVGLGAADMDGSDSALHEPNPLISVSDPTGAPIPTSGNSSRTHGSPYPLNAATLLDQSPLSAPSQVSRSPSPKPHTSAPLDIPSQPILSNGGSFNPSSANSIGNDAAESLGSNVAKDKLKSIDIDDMIQRLLDVGYTGKVSKSLCLKNSEITAICMAARDIFLNQPTLIELSPPVKIVGDVHGQYSDLIRLFEMCGFPPTANYLFLGDYVDRGKQSLETILLLLCYKIKYPENFFLLRGNHECANVTRGSYIPLHLQQPLIELIVYGFYDECKRRCNIKTWKTFIDVFNCLPIAAIVASKIFCVHGGLSPSLHTMEDIKRIQRPTDVPDYGLLNDLLWSDPSDTALDWEDNERGVSYCFGKAIINEFLVRYDMDLICRAHMVVEDGYEFWNDRTLVTVFSAPNYCGGASSCSLVSCHNNHNTSPLEFDNYGACMRSVLSIFFPDAFRSLDFQQCI